MITIKKFNELTNEELYEVMRLRQEVFVIEQTCIYPDLDKLDYDCWHVIARAPSSSKGNHAEMCGIDSGIGSGDGQRGGDCECDGNDYSGECNCDGNDYSGKGNDNSKGNVISNAADAGDDTDRITGYLRILPAGMTFDTMAIGRVLVREDCRGNGTARRLLEKSLEFLRDDLKEPSVKLSAQQYLIDFYKSLGFKIISEGYLEDGIPHIDMQLDLL